MRRRDAISAWVAALLILAVVLLLLQLFPSVSWTALAIVDVRGWPWWGYSLLFTAVSVALIAYRAREAQ
jgi:membrane protein implicated in regulation of membrane protease activity